MGFTLLCGPLMGSGSRSHTFGFHSELIEGGKVVPLGINVSLRPGSSVLGYTVGQLFGEQNEAGLVWNDPERRDGDIIWLKEPSSWLQIYFNNGWRAVGAGRQDYSRHVIQPNGGVFFQSSRENDYLLAFGGYLLTGPMVKTVEPGFNLVSRGFPVEMTLEETHLHDSPGLGPRDVVWIWSDSQYLRVRYNGEKWTDLTGRGDYGWIAVPSMLVIQVLGKGGTIAMHPPRYLLGKKTVDSRALPRPPRMYLSFGTSGQGNPTFVAQWRALSPKVGYTTEGWSRDGWFPISNRRGEAGEVLSDLALLHRLRNGVARVRADFAGPEFVGRVD